ncbi:Carbonic anhydrase 16 [Carabus blaptoides fortunei]
MDIQKQKYRFPLELHIVHYANIFNSTRAALGYDQGLAVLLDISKHDNPAFEPLIEILDDVKKVPGKSEHLDDAISISSFMPKNTASFFRYEDSLTTPGCDEVVVRTVFYQSSYIIKRQPFSRHTVY